MFVSTNEGSAWGGSEELWSQAAAVLAARGCEVVAFVNEFGSRPAAHDALRKSGVNLRYLRKSFARRMMAKAAQRLTGRDARAWSLRRLRPDLVVVSQGANQDGLRWMEACAASSTPYVAVSQAAHAWVWPNDDVASHLRAAYGRALKAYFVSASNVTLTQRQINAPIENSQIIRNPFKVPYEPDLPWPDSGAFRWGCVARLDTYVKGLDLLFDVLSRDKWRERPLVVTLYGSGSNAKSLRDLQEARGLRNVEFAGHVSSPVEIWHKEQCLILPSRSEGLPLTIVEAMLCGRPCIVTNVSGNADLLEDNETGFIASAATVESLDEAMERAWQHRENWERMGARAAKAVRAAVPPDPAGVFAEELLSLA